MARFPDTSLNEKKKKKNSWRIIGSRWCHSENKTKQINLSHQKSLHINNTYTGKIRDFLVAQSVKNSPAVKETQVRFLGWEDPLEKEMQSTPVFLPGKSHGQRSQAIVLGVARVRHDFGTKPPPPPVCGYVKHHMGSRKIQTSRNAAPGLLLGHAEWTKMRVGST